MKELRNIPRWAMILSLCAAAASATFAVLGVVHLFTGAGADQVLFDVVIAAALALGAWSVAVKGNPALSRRSDKAPNRQSPTRW
ncbi:hypothetical protein [Arthrobacter sp.]|uniref:hypothetical protein n=1 Tax=Arthrobacter sp. TaxID=1667 RepID=UPI0026DF1836|nr:hypothetical protein [Arthrobacter sp.]MDO5753497.1 hypothetical protein [Arthrobacter sp.]